MKLTVERSALGRTIEQLKIERGVPAKVSEPPAMRPDSAFTAFLARFFHCRWGDLTYCSAEVCHGERELSILVAGRFGAFTGLRKQEDFQAEFRRFCEKNGKTLDERYAWD